MEDKGAADDDQLVLNLVTYICSADFQNTFTRFYEEHCFKFDDVQEEQSHECFTVYEEFSKMFESKIGVWLQQKSISQSEFMSRCNEVRGYLRSIHKLSFTT